MKRASLRALTVAVVCAASATAMGFTPGASKWNPAQLPIGYRINAASAPASIGSAMGISTVDAAFATWAAPACTAWRARNDGASTMTRARAGDSERTILWIQGARGSWPSELGSESSTIGVTTPVWRSGGYFIDADIQFNAVGFTWGAGTAGTVDTQTIALHEEGHFLGLDHTSVRAAIMFASYGGGQNRSLNADDQAGVCSLYPSGMTPPPTDAGSPPRDASTPPVGGELGATCNMSSPCASGNLCVCRSASDCFCSRRCEGTPCPTGFNCTNTSVGSLCLPGGGTMNPTGRIGDPCTSGTECSTGICVRGTSGAFCSQVCADDCSCPQAFSCVATTQAGVSICAAGTNTCDTGTLDGGLVVPDSGNSGGGEDGGVMDAARDGGRVAPVEEGCRCSAPGRAGGSDAAHGALALAAVVAVTLGRRRKR
ncbi:MAG: matrixin family metalloprotease [Deltaproteobacteria bacterium]|nr:matrixin family metalloprotease [Deltaproteobacteria bacterium]